MTDKQFLTVVRSLMLLAASSDRPEVLETLPDLMKVYGDLNGVDVEFEEETE